jgi:hypothetical protein
VSGISSEFALLRALLIVKQMRENPAGVPLLNGPGSKSVKTRGRPRSTAPAKLLAEYNFDVADLKTLRALGVPNVPRSKAALDALMKRVYPNDPTPTRLNTIKKTLQRERARQRR